MAKYSDWRDKYLDARYGDEKDSDRSRHTVESSKPVLDLYKQRKGEDDDRGR